MESGTPLKSQIECHINILVHVLTQCLQDLKSHQQSNFSVKLGDTKYLNCDVIFSQIYQAFNFLQHCAEV